MVVHHAFQGSWFRKMRVDHFSRHGSPHLQMELTSNGANRKTPNVPSFPCETDLLGMVHGQSHGLVVNQWLLMVKLMVKLLN